MMVVVVAVVVVVESVKQRQFVPPREVVFLCFWTYLCLPF